jgi:hypothetical protein
MTWIDGGTTGDLQTHPPASFSGMFSDQRIQWFEAHGNVLTACAFLHGLARSELKAKELDFHDPDYQVIITVRAVKK